MTDQTQSPAPGDLPALPEMSYLGDDASYGYDANDMREYARAALAAATPAQAQAGPQRLQRDDTEHGVDYYRAADVDALLGAAAVPAQAVPAGCVLVPVEITRPMQWVFESITAGNYTSYQEAWRDLLTAAGAETQCSVAGHAEPLERFCPGCGSVGQVPDKFRDCCPDGGHARMIPASLAERCHDLFKLALQGATAPQPVAQPLSDKQIAAAMTGYGPIGLEFGVLRRVTRAIERAHGIGSAGGEG